MLANALFSPSILLAELIEIGLISVEGRSGLHLFFFSSLQFKSVNHAAKALADSVFLPRFTF
jgi:hypothetical protein